MKRAVKQFYKNTKKAKPKTDYTKWIVLAAAITGALISIYVNLDSDQNHECTTEMCLIK